jgi:hypothetical protein
MHTEDHERVNAQYDKLSGGYDNLLAVQSFRSKLVCKIVRGFPDTAYSELQLSRLSDKFDDVLLDVSVGTGLFTRKKYLRTPNSCRIYVPGGWLTLRFR